MLTLTDLQPCQAPSTTIAGQRVLEAATELFYLRGIGRTGVDLIAERAEVTKRTLYQRFGSKDALVAAYLQRRAHIWQTYLLEGLRTCDGALLAAFYDLVTQWTRRNTRGCAFVNAWVEIADAEHPAIAVIRAEKQWMRELFSVLAAGNDALAHTWHLLYEGAQLTAAIQGCTQPFDTALLASQNASSSHNPL